MGIRLLLDFLKSDSKTLVLILSFDKSISDMLIQNGKILCFEYLLIIWDSQMRFIKERVCNYCRAPPQIWSRSPWEFHLNFKSTSFSAWSSFATWSKLARGSTWPSKAPQPRAKLGRALNRSDVAEFEIYWGPMAEMVLRSTKRKLKKIYKKFMKYVQPPECADSNVFASI